MAKGAFITKAERKNIKSLFKTIGDVSKVAKIAKRDPASVRRIVQPKEIKSNHFNWENFNNSIIL